MAKPRARRPSIVRVRWLDAWDDSRLDPETGGWRTQYLCELVGYLVRDEPELISVAGEILEPDGPKPEGYRAVSHVPRPLIVDMTYVEGGPSDARDDTSRASASSTSSGPTPRGAQGRKPTRTARATRAARRQ